MLYHSTIYKWALVLFTLRGVDYNSISVHTVSVTSQKKADMGMGEEVGVCPFLLCWVCGCCVCEVANICCLILNKL